jgi:hypothetical protein
MKAKIVICFFVLIFSVFAGNVFGGTENADYTYYGINAGGTSTWIGNTFLGVSAGANNAWGPYNTFVGLDAGFDNISGGGNTYLGYAAGYFNDGNMNTFVGHAAGSCITGGNYNIYIGANSGGCGTSNNNIHIGFNAGAGQTGSNKLFIDNTGTSTNNPLIYGDFVGTGGNPILAVNGFLGIGTKAPVRMLHLSGSNAVFRMDRSADTAAFQIVRTDGSGNPMKVFVAGVNASGYSTGEFVINDNGNALSGAGNRRMTIGNTGAVTFTGTVTAAGYYQSSSLTLKDNVRTYENALDTVNRLRGVSFDWKESGKPSVGLIAEEVAKVVPEVVAFNDGAATGVNYASLVGVLVEAVKEQQGIVKEQQKAILTLQKELNELKGTIR